MVASRPQPARGGGITTVHIWLIVFVALWLVSTVLAVLLYTGREELVAAADEAEDRAERLMRRNEATRFNVYMDKAGDRQSLAAVLDNERVAMARLIGVDETTSASAAANLVNEETAGIAEGAPAGADLPDLENTDLLTVVNRLQAAWKAQAQAVVDTRKRLAGVSQELDQATGQRDAEKKKHESEIAQLEKKLEQIEADKNAAITKKDQQIKAGQQKVTEVQDKLGKQLVDSQKRLSTARKESAELQRKLNHMKDQLKQFRPKVASLGLAAQADGEVIRARADEALVYINLGKRDHLMPGLRFGVFSPSAHVELFTSDVEPTTEQQPGEGGRAAKAKAAKAENLAREQERLLRGKATIEVVGIHDRTAECRVIESAPTDPIVPGDLVVNVVYDRNRKYRFVVEGQFDIDGDGRFDPEGRQKIQAWIETWGGEVVTLPKTVAPGGWGMGLETVDFLVLGVAPPRPPRGQADAAKPEVRRRNEDLQRAYDRFVSIKREARDLSLAVLTQSQFLRFIGHGGGKNKAGLGT